MAELTSGARVELRQGPQQPHSGTPPRHPDSMRRTTTHTCLRPDGLAGGVQVLAAGRDMWTGSDGRPWVVAQAKVDADVDFAEERELRAIHVDPPIPVVGQLLGRPVAAGFRKAVDEVTTDEDRIASLRYQLLDDLPTAVLVSGVVVAAAGLHRPPGSYDLTSRADICAGWATDGTILNGANQMGHVPFLAGPDAPELGSASDPMAWHPLDAMVAHSTHRWRRIDVWSKGGSDPGALAVEGFFRDSYIDGDGRHTVVHEYLVHAELGPGTYTFQSCRADIGVLPWVDCPAAAASATRLVGTGPDDLRQRVRGEFVGTTTCTHLNDTLRAFAALGFLARMVEAGGPAGSPSSEE